MQRRKFSRGFKFEAVRLVRGRDVTVAQAARDLDLNENGLRPRPNPRELRGKSQETRKSK